MLNYVEEGQGMRTCEHAFVEMFAIKV